MLPRGNSAWTCRLATVTAIMLLSIGCTYRGETDNPVVRRATWFSYLDGTDLRTACGEGASDRFRLVYNARYEQQVRSYEITADGTGGAYLVARARGPERLAVRQTHRYDVDE